MKRAIFVLMAAVVVAGSSGCCCVDRLFCWGCRGGCSYGNEGPCYGGCSGCGGGCGNGGCSDCGMAGGTVTGNDYAGGPGFESGPGQGPGPGMAGRGRVSGGRVAQRGPAPGAMAQRGVAPGQPPLHPADGHPHAHQRRNADGEYEFAAGPPTGGVTYPYYTNRGPRDFLARNPRSIGP